MSSHSQPQLPKLDRKGFFRRSILAPDSGHAIAALLFIQNIHSVSLSKGVRACQKVDWEAARGHARRNEKN